MLPTSLFFMQEIIFYRHSLHLIDQNWVVWPLLNQSLTKKCAIAWLLEPITIHSLGLGAWLLEQTCGSSSKEKGKHTASMLYPSPTRPPGVPTWLSSFPPPSPLNSCSSFKVQPCATSSVKHSLLAHPPLCALSLLSICNTTSLDCLVRQFALSMVASLPTVSFSRAGTLCTLDRRSNASKGSTEAEDWRRPPGNGGVPNHSFTRKSRLGSAGKDLRPYHLCL